MHTRSAYSRLILPVSLLLSVLTVDRGATSAAASPGGDTLFVSSIEAGTITRIDLATLTTTTIVTGLSYPEDGVCGPDGRIYFAEGVPGRITRFEQDGTGATALTTGGQHADGLAFDAAGNLFFNTRGEGPTGVWKIAGADPATAPVNVVPPYTSWGAGVAIAANQDILAADTNGTKVVRSPAPGYGPAHGFVGVLHPVGIAVDTLGYIYVVDAYQVAAGMVRKFTDDGGSLGVVASGLDSPRFLEVDATGNIYIANESGAILKVAADGTTTTIADVPWAAGVALCGPTHQPVIEYYALGDSIASGHGLGDDGTTCHQSTRAYPYRVAAALATRYDQVNFPASHFLACSGATALEPNALPDPAKWLRHQVALAGAQIAELPPDRSVLVSITIGATDLKLTDYPGLLNRIVQPGDSYFNWVSSIASKVAAELKSQVEFLLTFPNVAVVITQVHNPVNRDSIFFSSLPGSNCADVLGTQTCYDRTDYAVAALNNALVQQVSARLGQPDRLRTTPTLNAAFYGHESPRPSCGRAGPNVKVTWIQYIGDPTSNSILPSPLGGLLGQPGDCFHPNDKGAQAYADRVSNAAQEAGH
jgi:hypothetical protein